MLFGVFLIMKTKKALEVKCNNYKEYTGIVDKLKDKGFQIVIPPDLISNEAMQKISCVSGHGVKKVTQQAGNSSLFHIFLDSC